MARSLSSYKPKFSRVLIKREIKDKIGSIIIPDDQAKRYAKCEGVIVAMGETAGFTESYNEKKENVIIQTMKVGDTVIFGRHSGAWLDASFTDKGAEKDDGTLFICQDQDILAIIEG